MQNIWAQLIANALDPNFKGKISYGFIEIIKSLNPKEAYMLQRVYKAVMNHDSADKSSIRFEKKDIMLELNLEESEYNLMANNLIRVQCFSPGVVIIPGIIQNGYSTTIYRGIEEISITELGIEFVKACINDIQLDL